jgi:formylglycine-generating enzyme required for sulfatase activity
LLPDADTTAFSRGYTLSPLRGWDYSNMSLFLLFLFWQAPQNMVEIKAGEFWMGRVQMFRPDEQGYLLRPRIDDLPAHLTHIDTFLIDKTEVTQDDYSRFVQAAKHRAPFHWKDGRIPDGQGQFPVYNVSWDDAAAYCGWAGKRLPTEAEWEKAARGGLDKKRYPWGDQLRPPAQDQKTQGPKLAHYAFPNGPAKVASYPANAFGLHDAMGNVAEWVSDWYDRSYYAVSPEANPRGPDSGMYRVIRGSSWADPIETGDEVEPRVYGVYFRNFLTPSHRTSVVGFRCARTP